VFCIVGNFRVQYKLIPTIRAVFISFLKQRHILLEAFHTRLAVHVDDKRMGNVRDKLATTRELFSEARETVKPLAPSVSWTLVLQRDLRIRDVLAHGVAVGKEAFLCDFFLVI
jgi:hypothetical protein